MLAFRGLKTFVGLGITIALIGCSGGDPEIVAEQVARDWTIDSISSISSEIGSAVTGELPVLANVASSIVEDQLRDKVRWNFSTPIERSKERYEVLAEATATFDVKVPLVLDKTLDVAATYELMVDTDKAEVVNARLDVSSLSISER